VKVPEENHVSVDGDVGEEVAGVQELQELQNKKLESGKAWGQVQCLPGCWHALRNLRYLDI
jgi:hypothetical protein